MAMITKVEIREGKKPVLVFRDGDGIFSEYRHELDRCERIEVDHTGVRFTMFVAAEDETMISVQIGPDVAEALRRLNVMSDRIEKLEAMLAKAGVVV